MAYFNALRHAKWTFFIRRSRGFSLYYSGFVPRMYLFFWFCVMWTDFFFFIGWTKLLFSRNAPLGCLNFVGVDLSLSFSFTANSLIFFFQIGVRYYYFFFSFFASFERGICCWSFVSLITSKCFTWMDGRIYCLFWTLAWVIFIF